MTTGSCRVLALALVVALASRRDHHHHHHPHGGVVAQELGTLSSTSASDFDDNSHEDDTNSSPSEEDHLTPESANDWAVTDENVEANDPVVDVFAMPTPPEASFDVDGEQAMEEMEPLTPQPPSWVTADSPGNEELVVMAMGQEGKDGADEETPPPVSTPQVPPPSPPDNTTPLPSSEPTPPAAKPTEQSASSETPSPPSPPPPTHTGGASSGAQPSDNDNTPAPPSSTSPAPPSASPSPVTPPSTDASTAGIADPAVKSSWRPVVRTQPAPNIAESQSLNDNEQINNSDEQDNQSAHKSNNTNSVSPAEISNRKVNQQNSGSHLGWASWLAIIVSTTCAAGVLIVLLIVYRQKVAKKREVDNLYKWHVQHQQREEDARTDTGSLSFDSMSSVSALDQSHASGASHSRSPRNDPFDDEDILALPHIPIRLQRGRKVRHNSTELRDDKDTNQAMPIANSILSNHNDKKHHSARVRSDSIPITVNEPISSSAPVQVPLTAANLAASQRRYARTELGSQRNQQRQQPQQVAVCEDATESFFGFLNTPNRQTAQMMTPKTTSSCNDLSKSKGNLHSSQLTASSGVVVDAHETSKSDVPNASNAADQQLPCSLDTASTMSSPRAPDSYRSQELFSGISASELFDSNGTFSTTQRSAQSSEAPGNRSVEPCTPPEDDDVFNRSTTSDSCAGSGPNSLSVSELFAPSLSEKSAFAIQPSEIISEMDDIEEEAGDEPKEQTWEEAATSNEKQSPTPSSFVSSSNSSSFLTQSQDQCSIHF